MFLGLVNCNLPRIPGISCKQPVVAGVSFEANLLHFFQFCNYNVERLKVFCKVRYTDNIHKIDGKVGP